MIMVNVKHVIMRQKIEEIVRKMNYGEIEPEDGIDELCDLHIVSNQRKLLIAFDLWVKKNKAGYHYNDVHKSIIEFESNL